MGAISFSLYATPSHLYNDSLDGLKGPSIWVTATVIVMAMTQLPKKIQQDQQKEKEHGAKSMRNQGCASHSPL